MYSALRRRRARSGRRALAQQGITHTASVAVQLESLAGEDAGLSVFCLHAVHTRLPVPWAVFFFFPLFCLQGWGPLRGWGGPYLVNCTPVCARTEHPTTVYTTAASVPD